jgi:hypothetical protein
MKPRKFQLTTDSRKRITLPPETGVQPGDILAMEVIEEGKILLTPVLMIPKHLIEKGTLVDGGTLVSIIPRQP